MQRELWRNRWLSSLNELTSLELQRASWLDKENANPHWSFVEFMCVYFDDLCNNNNYENQLKNGWLSQSEFETIKNWHELLGKYDSPKNDDHNCESIINDDVWQMIVREGQSVIKQLQVSLSEKEIQILTKEIDYTKYS
jgi:hypothetical protein